jgi:hypothetical protein
MMEAFAKKKGKEGTRGAAQIARENVATLTFYRNMILGANGIYFTVMTLLGRNYFAFEITMWVLSALIYTLRWGQAFFILKQQKNNNRRRQ